MVFYSKFKQLDHHSGTAEITWWLSVLQRFRSVAVVQWLDHDIRDQDARKFYAAVY